MDVKVEELSKKGVDREEWVGRRRREERTGQDRTGQDRTGQDRGR